MRGRESYLAPSGWQVGTAVVCASSPKSLQQPSAFKVALVTYIRLLPLLGR